MKYASFLRSVMLVALSIGYFMFLPCCARAEPQTPEQLKTQWNQDWARMKAENQERKAEYQQQLRDQKEGRRADAERLRQEKVKAAEAAKTNSHALQNDNCDSSIPQ